MNITTIKHLIILISLAFLAACSSQNTSVSGTESRLSTQSAPGSQSSAGGQSMPGSQLLASRQNKDATKRASTTKAKKLPTAPKSSASSSKMRKIVLKAPKTTIKPTVKNTLKPRTMTTMSASRSASSINPRDVYNKVMNKKTPAVQPRRSLRPTTRRPAAPVNRPVVTQPYSAPIIANPVRSAPPLRRPTAPIRPVVPVRPAPKPVVKAPAPKPQSTLRRLTLNGSANFKSGSSKLTSKGQTKLLVLALSLQESNTQISRLLIEGHTDSVGNAAMNQALSLRRANAVAEYMAKQGGFQRSMMETVGLGESKPIASNKTKKGRAQNRRVEITATGTRRINR